MWRPSGLVAGFVVGESSVAFPERARGLIIRPLSERSETVFRSLSERSETKGPPALVWAPTPGPPRYELKIRTSCHTTPKIAGVEAAGARFQLIHDHSGPGQLEVLHLLPHHPQNRGGKGTTCTFSGLLHES